MNVNAENAKQVLVIHNSLPPSIDFMDADNNVIGTLRIDRGEFAFDGDPYDSAKAFLEAVNSLLSTWVESLKDQKV